MDSSTRAAALAVAIDSRAASTLVFGIFAALLSLGACTKDKESAAGVARDIANHADTNAPSVSGLVLPPTPQSDQTPALMTWLGDGPKHGSSPFMYIDAAGATVRVDWGASAGMRGMQLDRPRVRRAPGGPELATQWKTRVEAALKTWADTDDAVAKGFTRGAAGQLFVDESRLAVQPAEPNDPLDSWRNTLAAWQAEVSEQPAEQFLAARSPSKGVLLVQRRWQRNRGDLDVLIVHGDGAMSLTAICQSPNTAEEDGHIGPSFTKTGVLAPQTLQVLRKHLLDDPALAGALWLGPVGQWSGGDNHRLFFGRGTAVVQEPATDVPDALVRLLAVTAGLFEPAKGLCSGAGAD